MTTTEQSSRSGFRTLAWAGLALLAILAVVFAFTDEAISNALYDPRSGWADFLERYGQTPGAFVGLMGGSVLTRLATPSKGIKSILAAIGLGVLTFFMALSLMADATGLQAYKDPNPVLILVGAVAIVIVGQLTLRLLPRERLEGIKPAAKVALALPFLAAVLTVWGIKIPWGRWTYRDILEAGDPLLFSPWFIPQGNNGHHSFISGHTAFSFSVLPATVLFLGKSKTAFKTALAVALTWGVVGALGRVLVRAHFASDTLFAAALTTVWFVILSRHFGAFGQRSRSRLRAES